MEPVLAAVLGSVNEIQDSAPDHRGRFPRETTFFSGAVACGQSIEVVRANMKSCLVFWGVCDTFENDVS